MASIKSFEELELWQFSRELMKKIILQFNQVDDRNTGYLKNHLYKTAGSIMDNIAEGFERSGNKELIHFLSFSKGSSGELRSQLYRAYDFKLIDQQTLDKLIEENRIISIQLNNFINYLKRSDLKGSKFHS